MGIIRGGLGALPSLLIHSLSSNSAVDAFLHSPASYMLPLLMLGTILFVFVKWRPFTNFRMR